MTRADLAERRAQPVDQQLQRQHHAFQHRVDQRVCERAERRRRSRASTIRAAASTDPQNWGVPSLSFAGFTGLQGAPASVTHRHRITTSYVWSHPFAKHQLRFGGDYRLDTSTRTRSTSTRRGSVHVHRALLGGGSQSRPTGAAFADFLLGAAAAGHAPGRRHQRAARPIVRRVHRRQLAEELEADVQPRPPLRAGDAVHRSQRPAREPGCRAGLHGRRPGARRRERTVHRRVSRRR